jgi:hypothetical protein
MELFLLCLNKGPDSPRRRQVVAKVEISWKFFSLYQTFFFYVASKLYMDFYGMNEWKKNKSFEHSAAKGANNLMAEAMNSFSS